MGTIFGVPIMRTTGLGGLYGAPGNYLVSFLPTSQGPTVQVLGLLGSLGDRRGTRFRF